MPVDSFNQYTPYLQYLKDTILGTNSMFYSLGKSLGGEMYGVFTYYLMSPFNLLVIFFSKEQIGTAFYLIMFTKISISSSTFYYLLNRKKEAKGSGLIFSCMYALCSAVITYGHNIMWLDSLILLPILCAGIDDIIDGKRPILYIISLALTLITNYYMGFMICIFAGIYLIYKLIINGLKPAKETLRKIGKFALFSILAVMISSIVLIPSFFGIREGRADPNLFEDLGTNFEFLHLIPKFFSNAFGLSEIGNYAMPPIFCSVLANFLVLLYFTNSKIKLKEKLCTLVVFVIFFASFYIDRLNLAWVLGSRPACYKYRYIFCYVFFYILIAHKSFENLKDGVKTSKMILASLIIEMAGAFALYLNLDITNETFVKIDMILVLIFFIIFEIYRFDLGKIKKYGSQIIITLLFLINLVNLVLDAENSMKILQEGTSKNKMDDQIFLTSFREYKYREIEKYDQGLFRQETTNVLTGNGGITYGYNGVSFSASTYSKKLHDFMRNMGFGEEHVTVSMNTGNTETMDMLLGIKYILGEDNKKYKNYIEEKLRRDRGK